MSSAEERGGPLFAAEKHLALASEKRQNAAMKIADLRTAVAQMVMPRVEGKQLADPAYRSQALALVREGLGGFILFGGNVTDTPQFLEELQAQAAVPLLISSEVDR